jgi:hypothetical protein
VTTTLDGAVEIVSERSGAVSDEASGLPIVAGADVAGGLESVPDAWMVGLESLPATVLGVVAAVAAEEPSSDPGAVVVTVSGVGAVASVAGVLASAVVVLASAVVVLASAVVVLGSAVVVLESGVVLPASVAGVPASAAGVVGSAAAVLSAVAELVVGAGFEV